MKKPTECPKCRSKNVKYILYGLPAEEPSGDVILGGCVIIEGESPDWHCGDCRWEWGHGAGRYAELEDEE